MAKEKEVKTGEWKKIANKDFNPMIFIHQEQGQETTGIYKGVRLIEKDGESSAVHSIDIDGKTHDFWGTGQLNYLLKQVDEGTEICIIYTGLEKITMKKNGKKMTKEVHQFEVYSK